MYAVRRLFLLFSFHKFHNLCATQDGKQTTFSHYQPTVDQAPASQSIFLFKFILNQIGLK